FGTGPRELARALGRGAQARVRAEGDAAIDADDDERRIRGVPAAALRVRDVVADRGRRWLRPSVVAIGALDMRGSRSAEGPQERDGQQWGDQQARAEGQLGS